MAASNKYGAAGTYFLSSRSTHYTMCYVRGRVQAGAHRGSFKYLWGPRWTPGNDIVAVASTVRGAAGQEQQRPDYDIMHCSRGICAGQPDTRGFNERAGATAAAGMCWRGTSCTFLSLSLTHTHTLMHAHSHTHTRTHTHTEILYLCVTWRFAVPRRSGRCAPRRIGMQP